MMIKMSDVSRKFLEENAPELLAIDDLDEFLDKLDEFIIINGLDANDDMTAFGHEAQAVYDEVYCCNE